MSKIIFHNSTQKFNEKIEVLGKDGDKTVLIKTLIIPPGSKTAPMDSKGFKFKHSNYVQSSMVEEPKKVEEVEESKPQLDKEAGFNPSKKQKHKKSRGGS